MRTSLPHPVSYFYRLRLSASLLPFTHCLTSQMNSVIPVKAARYLSQQPHVQIPLLQQMAIRTTRMIGVTKRREKLRSWMLHPNTMRHGRLKNQHRWSQNQVLLRNCFRKVQMLGSRVYRVDSSPFAYSTDFILPIPSSKCSIPNNYTRLALIMQ